MTITVSVGATGLFTLTNLTNQSQKVSGERMVPPGGSITVDYVGTTTAKAVAAGYVSITPSAVQLTPALSNLSIGGSQGGTIIANGTIVASGYGGQIDNIVATLATEVISLRNTLTATIMELREGLREHSSS